jgi:hypothetical protein
VDIVGALFSGIKTCCGTGLWGSRGEVHTDRGGRGKQGMALLARMRELVGAGDDTALGRALRLAALGVTGMRDWRRVYFAGGRASGKLMASTAGR